MRHRRLVVAAISLGILLGGLYSGGFGHGVRAQTGGWVVKAPMLLARTAAAAVTGMDGKIYVFGGSDYHTQDYSEAEVYDPSTDMWKEIAPMPVGESYLSGALGDDGKIYLLGGWDSIQGVSLNNVMAYDPTTNTYACSFASSFCASSSLRPMPVGRSVMAVTEDIVGRIWTIGGFTNQAVATVEVYDPTANSWTPGPSLPAPNSGGGAVTFPTGQILLAGGFDGQNYNTLAYILPPTIDDINAALKATGTRSVRARSTSQGDKPSWCDSDLSAQSMTNRAWETIRPSNWKAQDIPKNVWAVSDAPKKYRQKLRDLLKQCDSSSSLRSVSESRLVKPLQQTN